MTFTFITHFNPTPTNNTLPISLQTKPSLEEPTSLHMSVSMREVDDSFKKPGAVPFKWESKPGVPKPHHPISLDLHRPSPKLTPPPSGICFTPPPGLRGRSFQPMTRLRPDRHRVEPMGQAPPMMVFAGCLFSPFFRRWAKKKKVAHKASPEYGYESFDLGTLARWSDSTRKSLSLWESSSACSSSFSSHRSSHRPVRDPEWAGFGLF